MEEQRENSKKRIRKRKARKPTTLSASLLSLNNTATIFPLLLAATTQLSNSKKHTPYNSSEILIKKCLTKLHQSLISNNQTFPISVLSLFPIFMSSKCAGIVCQSAEIVGLASLVSLEINELVALDEGIVKGLILMLGSGKRKVSVAACNALLDLSSTSIGRQRLLEFSALERLMFGFLQVPASSILVSLYNEDEISVACARIAFKEDGHAGSILHAAITLINTCNIEQLEKIPWKLSENFLVSLKRLWEKVHNQMLLGNAWSPCREKDSKLSYVTVNSLAESIFRFSINVSEFVIPLSSVLVDRKIFGWSELRFENFLSRHWESFPSLIRRLSGSLIQEDDDILSSFAQSLNCKEPSPTFVSSILKRFISCVPIASDEMNIVSFLEEVRSELGCPLIYEQDIRVLRTEQPSKKEVHFFQQKIEPCCVKKLAFNNTDILKCEDAFKEGYTIALRGVEFRFASIAAVADALASLFGQPSVGANIYLTPPNSQGLARHCDDHCVFVCQLFGTKQWTIYPRTNLQLPRLYDPLDREHCFGEENSLAGCRKFLLRAGDILYIPRGFPHEASTHDSGSGDLARFSLHVTFGVEVEPPFEWEGFAHVALHCWYETQKQLHGASVEPSGILDLMSVTLLHLMIELIGASDSTLRKASLVGALLLPLEVNDWLYLDQKTTFNHIIDQINKASNFLEVFRSVEVALGKNEDPFYRMRWLRLLYQETETIQEHDWNVPLREFQILFPSCAQHKDTTEAAFMQAKSKFCDEVLFEDVIDSYKLLLEKYKKARKQYINGMLSLHCNEFLSS